MSRIAAIVARAVAGSVLAARHSITPKKSAGPSGVARSGLVTPRLPVSLVDTGGLVPERGVSGAECHSAIVR